MFVVPFSDGFSRLSILQSFAAEKLQCTERTIRNVSALKIFQPTTTSCAGEVNFIDMFIIQFGSEILVLILPISCVYVFFFCHFKTRKNFDMCSCVCRPAEWMGRFLFNWEQGWEIAGKRWFNLFNLKKERVGKKGRMRETVSQSETVPFLGEMLKVRKQSKKIGNSSKWMWFAFSIFCTLCNLKCSLV